MESPNAANLKTLIGFLEFDSKDAESVKAGLTNIEQAAAAYLSNHFTAVVMAADILDEQDAQIEMDKEMKA